MSSIALSEKESQVLGAVLSLMGELPDINYDELAPLIGVKYGKNAKTSVKKLFAKLKGGEKGDKGDVAGSSGGPVVGDDGAADTKPKKTSAKKATTKKGVGKSIAPKKASEGGPKAGTKTTTTGKKTGKKEVKNAKEDATMDEDAEQDAEAEAGKSTYSPPYLGKEPTSDDGVELSVTYGEVAFNASVAGVAGIETPISQRGRYLVSYDAGYELHGAELLGISINQWWQWRQENHYDVLQFSPTPL